MNLKRLAILAVVALTAIVSLLIAPQLPATMASHWNAAGEVNGTMPRFCAVFLVPAIMVFFILLFWVVAAVDPKRSNVREMRERLESFVLFFMLFLAYIDGLTLAWNLGHRFDMGQWIIPGIAALFYVIGGLVGSAKQNWFFGIRTPWTLSDERVWNETHRVGGIVYKITAVISLIGIFAPPTMAVWFVLVPIVIASIGIVVYSYVLFQRFQKR